MAAVTAKKSNTAAASSEAPTGVAELSYEQAMEQLEAIVDRIERGEIGLEESVKQYEQGVLLIARCREILGRAEQRVEELTKPAKGS
jgi:exodeoxyribonuclease VII small subunit